MKLVKVAWISITDKVGEQLIGRSGLDRFQLLFSSLELRVIGHLSFAQPTRPKHRL